VTKKLNVGFKGSSDCVFAYQLIKITSKRNDKFNEEDYNERALMDDESDVQDHGVEGLHEDWEIQAVDGDALDVIGTEKVRAYEEDR
jgi:hypothetical protein